MKEISFSIDIETWLYQLWLNAIHHYKILMMCCCCRSDNTLFLVTLMMYVIVIVCVCVCARVTQIIETNSFWCWCSFRSCCCCCYWCYLKTEYVWNRMCQSFWGLSINVCVLCVSLSWNLAITRTVSSNVINLISVIQILLFSLVLTRLGGKKAKRILW